ncbi:MAG: RNA 2',3'-cyclic phosphodiesterase [Acidimicrobiia bacterium]|nr:MAG: RNA 2',3'-cyclic phosphodiesterase [Acidimicrobiia bacterium]
MTRAFVAVRPPGRVLDAVAAWFDAPDLPGARFTTRDQWHVTLQFLGNRADVEAVAAALAPLAVEAGPVRLGGAGAFPTERRARVLWLGVAQGAERFARLAEAVGALLAPLGHEPEARPYHPHLTLARLRPPADVRPVLARLRAGPVGDAWTVREVVVYESHLRRTGARYEARARIPLPGRPPG